MKTVGNILLLIVIGTLWAIGFVIGFFFRPLYFGFGAGFNMRALAAKAKNEQLFEKVKQERINNARG